MKNYCENNQNKRQMIALSCMVEKEKAKVRRAYMKLVQDLPAIFVEFGEIKREAFLEIKEYKDKGIPVIGMYCAYFTTELAMAAGAIPVGLCSFSNETITAAERDLPKSMCPLVKSSYGFAISDRCPFFHFADLVI